MPSARTECPKGGERGREGALCVRPPSAIGRVGRHGRRRDDGDAVIMLNKGAAAVSGAEKPGRFRPPQVNIRWRVTGRRDRDG